MTGPAPGCRPGRDDLTARVVRALYPSFDLCTVGGTYVAMAKGVPCFAGPSLGAIARQTSGHEHPEADSPASPPGNRPAG